MGFCPCHFQRWCLWSVLYSLSEAANMCMLELDSKFRTLGCDFVNSGLFRQSKNALYARNLLYHTPYVGYADRSVAEGL